jgi:hypothetical protein
MSRVKIIKNETANAKESGSKKDPDRKTFMHYMPEYVNRAYSGLQGYSDRLRNYKRLRKNFLLNLNYDLNLNSPRSYNEKIQWKKLNDRNPLLTITADKYAVRSYIRASLGEKLAGELLIPHYYVTDRPENIPFDELPDKFVLKPNHGSSMHRIVKDKYEVSQDTIISECKKWLKVNFGYYSHEWAYRNIKRKIIVEKLLESKNGVLPLDFKLFCFHGKCKCIGVLENRLGTGGNSAFFDLQWNRLPVRMFDSKLSGKTYDKPSNLDQIVGLGEKLSEDFDSVRVDLYYCDGKIFFGELTHYHAAGFARFEPESFDFELGSHWKIDKDYWRKK